MSFHGKFHQNNNGKQSVGHSNTIEWLQSASVLSRRFVELDLINIRRRMPNMAPVAAGIDSCQIQCQIRLSFRSNLIHRPHYRWMDGASRQELGLWAFLL